MKDYKLKVTHSKEKVWRKNIEMQEQAARVAEKIFDLIIKEKISVGAMGLNMALFGVFKSVTFGKAFNDSKALLEAGLEIDAVKIEIETLQNLEILQ